MVDEQAEPQNIQPVEPEKNTPVDSLEKQEISRGQRLTEKLQKVVDILKQLIPKKPKKALEMIAMQDEREVKPLDSNSGSNLIDRQVDTVSVRNNQNVLSEGTDNVSNTDLLSEEEHVDLSLENKGKKWEEGSPNIDLDQICFVRSMDPNQLKVTNDGTVTLLPLAESSKGEIPRLTVHWTVNHKVASHTSGEWLGNSMVVVVPGKKMIEENGSPQNLNAVDTFWTRSTVLPEGSKILYMDEKPEIFKEQLHGVELVKLQVDKTEVDDLNKKKKSMELDYTLQTTNEYFVAGRELDRKVSEQVDGEISRMGYSLLNQDHGTYMGEKNLDKAVSVLAKEIGAKSSELHSDTLYGEMESNGLDFGPLMLLSEINKGHAGKSLAGSESVFSEAMGRADNLFTRYGIDTEGGRTIAQIFAGELYQTISNQSGVMENGSNRMSLNRLLENQKWLNTTLNSWAENDKQNSGKMKDKLKVISDSNPE